MTFGKFMKGFLGIAEKAAPVAAALVGGPVAGAALKGIAIVHDTVEAATQPDQTKTDLAITAALGALQETELVIEATGKTVPPQLEDRFKQFVADLEKVLQEGHSLQIDLTAALKH